ncbi:ABC transporter ATP-binding protein [Fictibacillus phosphorivorans]|uniref:ABC transporter ATP-binding protein n=1 Tax=Fictibacillus phosphorivorans TaxID=1221500 RepID=A0A165N752_9BACL|nr:ABC transporter ATP-binding protein [Fictibacillus phosphorivorans]KZE64871.1 ABC transporter ATP-binding protein [Fictibacillus phosphorivorans]
MRKVFSYLKAYRVAIGAALFLTLLELGVELLQPLIMAKIIDDGILKSDLSVVKFWGIVMFSLALAAFAAGIANSFFSAHVSQNYGFDIRRLVFEKVQSFSFVNFNKFPASSLITRMTNDVTQLQNTVFMSLRIMLRAPLLLAGGVIMSLIVNWKLAMVLVVALPFLLVFLKWVLNTAGSMFRDVQDKLDGVNRVMRENLMGMRLIKAFLRRDFEKDRFEQASVDLKVRTVSSLRLIEVSIPVLLFVMNIAILFILWFGSRQVNFGTIEVGEVVAIVNYSFRISSVLTIISFIIMAFSRAKASAQRIGEVLDTEVDLIEAAGADRSLLLKQGAVEFKDVSFSYPESDVPVLKNLSFSVKSGETLAILGSTGSGKTSLFQLVPRLYDVTAGEVLVDGKNVNEYPIETLRKGIGVVPQEAVLFTGSISENIGWGKEGASQNEIISAAKDAQIHETVEKLPNQYDTRVGQRGVNLSGGQKQRLSIARALVRKPKILMLDDSTSALDLKTEAKLLKALRTYSCTTFIITQKISTAMEADRILLLDDGAVEAWGTHEELLKNSPLYVRIVQSQFGEEDFQHVKGFKQTSST